MLKKIDPIITIVLSIVTCGLYGIYVYYLMMKDMSVMHPEESKPIDKSSEFVIFIVLSIVTCSIYTMIWLYQFGGVLKVCGQKDGIDIKEDGIFYPLLMLLGGVTCSITMIIAYFKLYSNYNALVDSYNAKNS